MAEAALDPASLDFRLAGGLGEDNLLLRGVVGLQSRCDEGFAARDGFARRAEQLSASMYGSSVLIAAVEPETPHRPVASVLSETTYGSRLRRAIELSNLLVDPECSDPETLAGVMVALACGGRRNRFRSVGIDVNPAHEAMVGSLRRLGFEKDEELSGIEVYVGVPPEDRYTIGSGQSAIRGAKSLPGGRDALRHARQALTWD